MERITSTPTTKLCSRCKLEKPTTEFFADKASKDGLYGYCKACNREKVQEWRENNPERHKELMNLARERRRAAEEKKRKEAAKVAAAEKRLLEKIFNDPRTLEIIDQLVAEGRIQLDDQVEEAEGSQNA